MSQSSSRSWVRVAGLVLGLSSSLGAALAGPPPAKGKPKKPPVSGPKSSALSAALNDKGPQIQQCAIEHAMNQGANKVDIDVRVTINKQGAVVDTQITTAVAGSGDNDKVKACVESVVRTAKFPAVATPLATAERTWTVAAE